MTEGAKLRLQLAPSEDLGNILVRPYGLPVRSLRTASPKPTD